MKEFRAFSANYVIFLAIHVFKMDLNIVNLASVITIFLEVHNYNMVNVCQK